MKLLILLILFPLILWGQDSYNKMISEYQKVIKISHAKYQEPLIKMIGQKAQVVASGKKFLVIRPLKHKDLTQYNNLLKKIKKSKYITSIMNDKIMVPRQLLDEKDCTHCAQADLTMQISSIDFSFDLFNTNCELYPKCKDANPAWAKMQIGADLSENIIEELNISNDTLATVAVVDSGFDLSTTEHFNVNNLRIEKGHNSAGNPNKDIDGHGTAVSGMIAAKGTGITSHINLDVYRVTEDNAGGSTSTAMIAASIEKACETADIVNVSWGSALDEISSSDISDELWYEEALKKGCIIVKAAGNSGYKHDTERAIPLGDPFVRVSASQSFGGESSFSTSGQISAPGEGVFSLLSSEHEYGSTTSQNSCEEDGVKFGPINGTSFSSPAIAGVMGQIITILRSRGQLPKDPSKKIKLVKSILMASTKVGSYFKNSHMVNALGAALIAQGITGYTEDQDALVNIANNKSSDKCQRSVANCHSRRKCESKKTCMNELRYKILVCDPIINQDAQNLQKTLQTLNEMELLNSANFNLDESLIDKEQIKKDLAKSWKNNIFLEREVSKIEIALNLFDIADSKNIDGFINISRFKELMKATMMGITFPIDNYSVESTTKSATDNIRERIIKYYKKMSPKDQEQLLRQMPMDKIENSTQISMLYLLKKDSSGLSTSVSHLLDTTITKMANEWVDGKLEMNSLQITLAAPIYDLFIEQNPQLKEKILRVSTSPLKHSTVHLTGYLLNSHKALNATERRKYAAKILNEKSNGADDNYEFILTSAIKTLMEEKSDEGKVTLEKAFLSNPKLELPTHYYNQFSFLTSKTNPLEGSNAEFWNSYLQKCIDDVKSDLDSKSESYDYNKIPRAFKNITKALFNNQSPHSEKLLDTKGSQIQTLLKKAAEQYVTLDHQKSQYEYKGTNFLTIGIIESIFDNTHDFENKGKLEILKEAMLPLKNKLDITYFPQSLRQKIRKLYDLGEE